MGTKVVLILNLTRQGSVARWIEKTFPRNKNTTRLKIERDGNTNRFSKEVAIHYQTNRPARRKSCFLDFRRGGLNASHIPRTLVLIRKLPGHENGGVGLRTRDDAVLLGHWLEA